LVRTIQRSRAGRSIEIVALVPERHGDRDVVPGPQINAAFVFGRTNRG
jgi:hypothetical protein